MNKTQPRARFLFTVVGSNWEHDAFGRYIDYPTEKMA